MISQTSVSIESMTDADREGASARYLSCSLIGLPP
jgi:hypothetical protein